MEEIMDRVSLDLDRELRKQGAIVQVGKKCDWTKLWFVHSRETRVPIRHEVVVPREHDSPADTW